MITVSNLGFQYTEQKPILSDISFSLKKGEIIAIVGTSGCGKSTLLRLIAGLLPCCSGKVDQHGTQIGFVFQEPALMPWATIAQNVNLPLVLTHQTAPKSVQETLEIVGLSGFEGRYPSEISGGQKMRVSIARAMVTRAETILLDEPFAALDELLRFQMNELILSLKTQLQLSAILVTHSLYEACYLADRVFVLSSGTMTAEITPNLNRSLSPTEQRSSPAFIKAVAATSKALERGAV